MNSPNISSLELRLHDFFFVNLGMVDSPVAERGVCIMD